MPELPEVETIVRLLAPHVEGKRIALRRAAPAPHPAVRRPRPSSRACLAGRTIRRVLRRGKYILLELDDVHPGRPPGHDRPAHLFPRRLPRGSRLRAHRHRPARRRVGVHPVDKHTHLILALEGGERVLFRDPRTFGKIFLVEGPAWAGHPRLSILGEEPLDLDVKAFLRRAASRRTARGPSRPCCWTRPSWPGVGNIYADEALFRSGIHPAHPVRDLARSGIEALLKAVQGRAAKGIRNSGTSFSDYRKPDGSEGDNYERLQVYGRGGLPCRRCRTHPAQVRGGPARHGALPVLPAQAPRGGRAESRRAKATPPRSNPKVTLSRAGRARPPFPRPACPRCGRGPSIGRRHTACPGVRQGQNAAGPVTSGPGPEIGPEAGNFPARWADSRADRYIQEGRISPGQTPGRRTY